MKNTFSRTFVKNGKYIKEEVIETSFDILQLKGKGIITHVGGNGRFKFKIDKVEFISTFEKPICFLAEDENNYYDYSLVEFNIDISKKWSKLYIYNTSIEYWKPIEE